MKCDSVATTQADINAGVVNVVVGSVAVKPAEVAVIKIKQLAGQLQA